VNTASSLKLGPIWQIAFVVRDIDAVMHRWARDSGVGPWLKVYDHQIQPNLVVHGVPTVAEVSISLAYSGDLMVEFIEQHNDVETAYAKAMRSGDENLHHLGFIVDDLEAAAAALEAGGHEPFQVGGAGGTSYRYYDTSPVPGVMTELVSIDPASPRGAVLDLKEASVGGDPFEVRRV
jgi:methylmalonyl-CoA/ethylmalonyl-CoA epimerase